MPLYCLVSGGGANWSRGTGKKFKCRLPHMFKLCLIWLGSHIIHQISELPEHLALTPPNLASGEFARWNQWCNGDDALNWQLPRDLQAQLKFGGLQQYPNHESHDTAIEAASYFCIKINQLKNSSSCKDVIFVGINWPRNGTFGCWGITTQYHKFMQIPWFCMED